MGVLDFVGQIFKPAAELVDNLHTSEDERLEKKATLLDIQTRFLAEALEQEKAQLEAKARIITAEAKSEHFVTATWRPITMLSFVAAVLAYWFGLTPEDLPESAVESMFTLVKIGVGGYIASRGAEKIVPGAMKAFRQKEET